MVIADDTPLEGSPAADVEMDAADEEVADDILGDGGEDGALPDVLDDDVPTKRITFLEYVKLQAQSSCSIFD